MSIILFVLTILTIIACLLSLICIVYNFLKKNYIFIFVYAVLFLVLVHNLIEFFSI